MVSYITESAGGDFRMTPEGQHEMVCCRVVDLGTIETEFQGEKKHQRKILISWEIPGERTTIDGRDLPMIHSERYTFSLHEKANLRNMLQNWRGRPFTKEDFAGPPNGFTIERLLGVPCYAQVMHETGGNGRTYANITSIMKYPGRQEAWPKAESELLFLDLDNFSQAVFDKLPKRLKAMIAETPEGSWLRQQGAMRFSPDGAAGGAAPAPDRAPAGTTASGFDDDIPF